MELGEKLLRARQEAGLSQRQLCGEEITRNMLSQIEHGTARPSMQTLQYLAARLGKTVGYFLDDAPNQGEDWQRLSAGEAAIAQGRYIYARELLEALPDTPEGLRRQKRLAMARLPGADIRQICEGLPSLDEELLLRARAALEGEDWGRCLRLLEAMEETDTPQWHLLRGRLHMGQGEDSQAIPHFLAAEEAYPEAAAACLEQCYRETEDYKLAYLYACKRRELARNN